MYIYDHALSGAHRQTNDELGAIIGSDERQRVRDLDKAPYRWICALDLQFPFQGSAQLNKGTGFLISNRHVLTAAHNVIPARGIEALNITVIPALDGSKLLQKSPVGLQKVKPGQPPIGSLTPAKWWVPNQYRTTLAPVWDFALLTLPKEWPSYHGMTYGYWSDTRYVPETKIVAVTPSTFVGTQIALSGYPADKCKSSACAPCISLAPTNYDPVRKKQSWASTQWEANGTVQPNSPPGLILYDADACTGMSGSPVWQRKIVEKREILELVAIHTGTHTRRNPQTGLNETLNRGIPMVAQLLGLLRQLMLSDGEQARF